MEFIPVMEFCAALSAGILVSLWSKFILPRLGKCACCGQPPAEPDDEVTSSSSSAAVISAATSAHF